MKEKKHNVNSDLGKCDVSSEFCRTNLAQFCLDIRSGTISGRKNLEQLWPVKDGAFAPLSEYVIPEDQRIVEDAFCKLLNGEGRPISCDYRSAFTGTIRNYRIMASADIDNPQKVNGMVQDITDSIREHNNLEETLLNQATVNECFAEIIKDNGRNSTKIVLKSVCKRLKASRTFILRFDWRDGIVVPDEEYLDDSVSAVGEQRSLKTIPFVALETDSRWYRTIASCNITCLDDIDAPGVSDRFGPWYNIYQKYGVKSVYNSKVVIDGKIWGIFVITYEKDKHLITPCEESFFQAVSHLVSIMRDKQESSAKMKSAVASIQTSAAQMEYGATLTKSAFFRMDRKSRAISGTRNLSNLLPVKNGYLVNTIEWVFPEDVPIVFSHLNKLDLNETSIETFDLRTRYFGDLRYLRMMFRKDQTAKESDFIGAVQDITEIMMTAARLNEARSLWELALNAIPSFFYIKNANNSFRYELCNKAYADFCKRPVNQIIGKSDYELTDDVAAKKSEKSDVEIMSGNDKKEFRELLYGPDGRQRLIQTIKTPFIGPQGNKLLIGIGNDITEMSEMLVRLNTLVSNQKAISDSLAILIGENNPKHAMCRSLAIIGEHMRASRCYIAQFNEKTDSLTCFSEYVADGVEPIRDVISDKLDFAHNLKQILAEKNSIVIDTVQSQLEESLFSEWTDFILRNDVRSFYVYRIMMNKKVWGYIALSFQDCVKAFSPADSEFLESAAHCAELLLIRMAYQDRLISAIQQAQDAESAKSIFLASMSHEIRTPLNAVIGFSELLQNGTQTEDERKDYLSYISSAGNALLELINDVLDISKLEAGQMAFKYDKCDFGAIITDVGNIFKQKCAERNLSFVKIIPIDFPYVWVDKLRIRQVLFNLIGNAVKFTESGSITVTVNFEEQENDRGKLVFSVSDTGIGISSEDQKYLFRPFAQANALRGTQAAKNGTGLGLAICRRMAEYMSGSLVVKSQLGEGSCFTVSLRNIKFEKRTVTNGLDKIASESESTNQIIRRQRVLLVDDIAINLKVVESMLRGMGASLITASSGKEALRKLEDNDVDCILTDLWMPGMNGAELVAEIRRKPRFSGIRIAAVTADSDGAANFDMSGFDSVILKPVSISSLRQFLGQK